MKKNYHLLKLISIITLLCTTIFFTVEVWCLTEQQERELIAKVASGFQEREDSRLVMLLSAELGRCRDEDEIYQAIMSARKGAINICIIYMLIERLPRIASYLPYITAAGNTGYYDDKAEEAFNKAVSNELAAVVTCDNFISMASSEMRSSSRRVPSTSSTSTSFLRSGFATSGSRGSVQSRLSATVSGFDRTEGSSMMIDSLPSISDGSDGSRDEMLSAAEIEAKEQKRLEAIRFVYCTPKFGPLA